MKTINDIKRMIKDIGTKGYRDGSSKKHGVLYHVIPFDEFSGIRTHKSSSPDEYALIKSDIGTFSGKVLDIGCANGYFTFNIAKEADKVVAYEGDKLVFDVNEAVREYKGINNIEFVNKYFDYDTACSLDYDFDTIIMLNVHMWIRKQLGEKITKNIMRELAKRCKRMYFQTVHQLGNGMYKVPELKTKEDVEKYLIDVGFTNIRLLGQNKNWGNRFMYVCSK